ncbi:MHYT domain-containing protein [Glycomyces arizonensis]|uniref:MHYT domain-containing protein n=1 Tax=Glycomyces arizonensis TaxID=256035 RepID=UPI0004093C4A|nr:MHYT domain-containing protein [Glycomyces arizonensis]
MSFGFAFAGSLLALMCMTQARKQFGTVRATAKRLRWIALAALALGGTAIWMMHFTAMIGFRVIESDIAYDPAITFLSLAVSIGSVFFGLSVAGMGRRNTAAKILMAGPLTGLGVVSMHYSGMAAINISGEITYDRAYFWAAVVIAVVAATAALACGMYLDGWKWQTAAAVVMAFAICGMHYTGMAGVRVELADQGRNPVDGIDPIMLILPILGVATVCIIVLLFALMGATPKTVSRREQLGIEIDENDGKVGVEPVPPQLARARRSAAPATRAQARSRNIVPDQRDAQQRRQPFAAVDGNREPQPTMNPGDRRPPLR